MDDLISSGQPNYILNQVDIESRHKEPELLLTTRAHNSYIEITKCRRLVNVIILK